jgi:2-methylcitrate dehydratase PrpD
MQNALIHHRPTNEFQAKFSMEYSMAILLVQRRAYIPEYQDKRINKPDVQNMLRKINFYKNKIAEAAGYDKMTTIIDIYLKNGKKISGRGDFGKGSPMIPMTYNEVADKFMGCCEFAKWPTKKAKAIIQAVSKLEKMKDISKLSRLLSK